MIIYQVDSFAKNAFSGNPAAVCILEYEVSHEFMQNIAMEMNLSETAFVYKKENEYNLRWFTPKVEVDLCGHATLAAAHILYEKGLENKETKIIFNTKSGKLSAKFENNMIVLDFPKEEVEKIEIEEKLIDIFGENIVFAGKNRMDILIELKNENEVKNFIPYENILLDIETKRGIIITSKSYDYDFISRFFAPKAGILEDSVTGSAHCALGPYWEYKLNKSNLLAYQASNRGGELFLEVEDERILIKGKAITVLECKFI